MKVIFLFLLSFFSLFSFAQSKLSYSISGGVGGSFRDLYLEEDHLNELVTLDGSSNGNELFDYMKNYMNKRESDQFTFSVMAKIHYHLNSKLSLASGFGYQNIGERFEDNEVVSFASLYGSIIPVYSGNIITEFFRYHYLSIPLEIRYNLFENNQFVKGNVGVTGGMIFNFLLDDTFDDAARYETIYKVLYGNPQTLALSGKVGVFYELKLSNDNLLVFEPQFRYFFTPNVKYRFGSSDDYIAVNQYNYVYEMKIGYRFNRLSN
jgi:hypothetical protein